MEPQQNTPPEVSPAPAPVFSPEPAPVITEPSQGWFKRHRRLVRWIIWPIVILVVLIILYFLMPTILHYVAGQDLPSAGDADLQLSKVPAPQTDNAYYDLIKISDMEIYEPEGFSSTDVVNGKSWNQAQIEEVLEKNMLALAYFSEAASRSVFQDPAYADPSLIKVNFELTPVNSWRTVSRLNVIKAEVLSRQGKGKEAMDEAFKSVRVGHLILQSQGTLVNYLVGSGIKNEGLEMIQQNLKYRQFSDAELNSYSRLVDNYKENSRSLETAFKFEHAIGSKSLEAVTDPEAYREAFGEDELGKEFAGKTHNRYWYKPNKTLSYFAKTVRERVKKVNEGVCGGSDEVELFFSKMTFFDTLMLPLTENAIGKILHDLSNVSLNSVLTRRCEQDAWWAAVKLHLAVKSYANNNGGKLPPSLDALVPTYIKEVPKDPFDGQPMRYSASKGVIYSIGENLQDDRGENAMTLSSQDPLDLTFKLN